VKRPAQPMPHPVNVEAPDHEGRGLSDRSAYRIAKPIVAWVGPILFLVGLALVFVTVGVDRAAVPATAVLGFAFAALGLWLDRLIENRRGRS
jgi:hypothetical protein